MSSLVDALCRHACTALDVSGVILVTRRSALSVCDGWAFALTAVALGRLGSSLAGVTGSAVKNCWLLISRDSVGTALVGSSLVVGFGTFFAGSRFLNSASSSAEAGTVEASESGAKTIIRHTKLEDTKSDVRPRVPQLLFC